MDARPTSLREIRAQLRTLPRDRRREIASAIRAGRAVNDPRDAPLAAAWADYMDRRRFTRAWPRWVMPRERPHGKWTWLWVLHAASIVVVIAIAFRYWWAWIPAPWRYLVLAWAAYTIVTLPFILARILRMHWNAPQTAAANRELVERTAGSSYRT